MSQSNCFQDMQPLGKVCIVPKGNYSGDLEYEVLDVVNYFGSSYIATQHVPIGVTPSWNNSNDYWKLLSACGAGTPSLDSNSIYEFSSPSSLQLEGIERVAGVAGESGNVPVNSLVTAIKDTMYNAIKVSILEGIYPIGSLYFTFTSNGPADELNFGKWYKHTDVFLRGTGSNEFPYDFGGNDSVTVDLGTQKVVARIGFAEASDLHDSIYFTRASVGDSDFQFDARNKLSANATNILSITGAVPTDSMAVISNLDGIGLKGSINIATIPHYEAVNIWERINLLQYRSNTAYSSRNFVAESSSSNSEIYMCMDNIAATSKFDDFKNNSNTFDVTNLCSIHVDV